MLNNTLLVAAEKLTTQTDSNSTVNIDSGVHNNFPEVELDQQHSFKNYTGVSHHATLPYVSSFFLKTENLISLPNPKRWHLERLHRFL